LAAGAADNSVHVRRAGALAGLGKYEEARTEVVNVLKEAPGDSDAQLQLGLIYIMQKKLPEAQEIFRRLHAAMADDLRPLQGLVQTYVLQTQADAAVQVLTAELKRRPNAPELKLLLGDTATSFGRYDLAIEQYQQVLAANPNNTGDIHFRVGQVYLAKGDLSTAIAHYQKSASVNPKDARAWAFLASAEQDAGKAEQAKADYKRALDLRPGHPALLNNLAYLIAETGGNLDDALKYAQQALHIQPENPDFADTMGLVLLKKDNTDSALQILGRLARKYPENPSFRYHFAMALVKKGDREKARNELKATLNLKRSKEEDKKIQELIQSIG
jgi:tetratricopeptide (TPR) repeat protein